MPYAVWRVAHMTHTSRIDRDERRQGMASTAESDDVRVLRRWVDAGGIVRIVARHADEVTVALLTCTAGEEAERLSSSDPAVAQWLAAHPEAQ
jgi:hypothetical protein